VSSSKEIKNEAINSLVILFNRGIDNILRMPHINLERCVVIFELSELEKRKAILSLKVADCSYKSRFRFAPLNTSSLMFREVKTVVKTLLMINEEIIEQVNLTLSDPSVRYTVYSWHVHWAEKIIGLFNGFYDLYIEAFKIERDERIKERKQETQRILAKQMDSMVDELFKKNRFEE